MAETDQAGNGQGPTRAIATRADMGARFGRSLTLGPDTEPRRTPPVSPPTTSRETKHVQR